MTAPSDSTQPTSAQWGPQQWIQYIHAASAVPSTDPNYEWARQRAADAVAQLDVVNRSLTENDPERLRPGAIPTFLVALGNGASLGILGNAEDAKLYLQAGRESGHGTAATVGNLVGFGATAALTGAALSAAAPGLSATAAGAISGGATGAIQGAASADPGTRGMGALMGGGLGLLLGGGTGYVAGKALPILQRVPWAGRFFGASEIDAAEGQLRKELQGQGFNRADVNAAVSTWRKAQTQAGVLQSLAKQGAPRPPEGYDPYGGSYGGPGPSRPLPPGKATAPTTRTPIPAGSSVPPEGYGQHVGAYGETAPARPLPSGRASTVPPRPQPPNVATTPEGFGQYAGAYGEPGPARPLPTGRASAGARPAQMSTTEARMRAYLARQNFSQEHIDRLVEHAKAGGFSTPAQPVDVPSRIRAVQASIGRELTPDEKITLIQRTPADASAPAPHGLSTMEPLPGAPQGRSVVGGPTPNIPAERMTLAEMTGMSNLHAANAPQVTPSAARDVMPKAGRSDPGYGPRQVWNQMESMGYDPNDPAQREIMKAAAARASPSWKKDWDAKDALGIAAVLGLGGAASSARTQ